MTGVYHAAIHRDAITHHHRNHAAQACIVPRGGGGLRSGQACWHLPEVIYDRSHS